MYTPNVLMVGPGLSGGGAEGRFRRIAGAVMDGQADVAVLAAHCGENTLASKVVINLRWRGQASYPRIIWNLAQRIRRERYDVVMGFGMFPNLLAVAATRLAASGSRVVIHEISRPRKLVERASPAKRFLYLALQRLILRHADVMTANSIDGLRELVQLCGGFRGPTARLHNAHDIADLERRAAEGEKITLPAPYAVCVGRLDPMKRVDTAIAAIAALVPDIEVLLVIVGDGEARKQLEEQATEAGICAGVKFLGSKPNPLGIMREASALILPSEYEGFSNSVIEAMLLGVPVITSDCSSDATAMISSGAALGFQVGDADGLALALERILTEPMIRDSLRAKGYHYAEQHVGPPAISRYDEVLRSAALLRLS